MACRNEAGEPTHRPGGRPWTALAAIRRRIDARRIREHLRRTEQALREDVPEHLSAEQRARRERHLDALREYWQTGEFPTNRESIERVPCFVGANGVPCAVAAMMVADGQEELVETVADANNTVRIEDLEDGPVLEWIEANGFTQAEAARIQPNYGPDTVHFAVDCGPVACRTARAVVATGGAALFLGMEWLGYRIAGSSFPDNVFKRRVAFGYLTLLNLVVVPLLAVFAYALLP